MSGRRLNITPPPLEFCQDNNIDKKVFIYFCFASIRSIIIFTTNHAEILGSLALDSRYMLKTSERVANEGSVTALHEACTRVAACVWFS